MGKDDTRTERDDEGGVAVEDNSHISRRSLMRKAATVAALGGAGLAGAALRPEDAAAAVIATDLADGSGAGSVNVSAAAAPTAGAVLTASSATAATWVAPVAAQYFEMGATAPVNGNTPAQVNTGLADQNIINGNQQLGIEYFSGSFNVPAGHTSALITAEVTGSTLGKGWIGVAFDYGQPTGGGLAAGLPMRVIYQSAPRTGVTSVPLGIAVANTSGTLWRKTFLATGLSAGTNYFSFTYGEKSAFAWVKLPTGSAPIEIALTNPDIFGVQRTLYVTAYNTGKLYPITLNQYFNPDYGNYAELGTLGSAITVGNAPVGVAITNDSTGSWPNQVWENTYAICCNFLSASLSVIATSNNTVYTTVALPAGSTPFNVAVAPDNSVAYVTDTSNNRVFPITSIGSGGTFTVGAAIAVGAGPSYLTFTPDGKHVYVSNSSANTVSVINVATNAVIHTVTVGNGPAGLAATPKPPTTGNPASAADFTVWVGTAGTNKLVPITDSTGAAGTAVSFAASVAPASTVITSDGYCAYTTSTVTTSSNMVQTVLQGPGAPTIADYGAVTSSPGVAQTGGAIIANDGTYYTVATGLDEVVANPGCNFYCRPDTTPPAPIPNFEHTNLLVQVI